MTEDTSLNNTQSNSEELEPVEPAGGDLSAYEESPPWSQNIKLLAAVATLLMVVAVVNRFTDLILRIVAAGIIAYVLTPLINFIAERSPLSRGAAIAVTYLMLILLIIGFGVILGVNAFQQVESFVEVFPTLVDNIAGRIASVDVIIVGPLSFDVPALWGAGSPGSV